MAIAPSRPPEITTTVPRRRAPTEPAQTISTDSGRIAVQLEHVTKQYRGGGGVRDLCLAVDRGEVFGFLGPNGAGKTTTIRLLLDLIRPDAGRVSVLGMDARRDSVAVRREVGYLPGELALYERLSARELLTHFAHLRVGPAWADIAEMAERFALDLDRPIHSLSKGNKQKVGLIQAFMNRPNLVVLDEPTSGLDPLAQRLVHQLMAETIAAGKTVFLSSHVLSEVAAVADRVGIIRDGRLITVETIAALRSRAVHRMQIRFVGPAPADVRGVPGVRHVEIDGHTVRVDLVGSVDPVIKWLAHHEVLELTVHEPDLEEVFLRLYEEERGDDTSE